MGLLGDVLLKHFRQLGGAIVPSRKVVEFAGATVEDVGGVTRITIAETVAGGPATQLATTGAAVTVSGAAPPSVGQKLVATSPTAANWQSDTPYLPLAGGTMAGDIDMGEHQIAGLGAPTSDADAATKKYVDDNVGGASLPLSGGTMEGDIDMDEYQIVGLGTPTSNYDAATKKYVDDSVDDSLPLAGGTMEGAIDCGGNPLRNFAGGRSAVTALSTDSAVSVLTWTPTGLPDGSHAVKFAVEVRAWPLYTPSSVVTVDTAVDLYIVVVDGDPTITVQAPAIWDWSRAKPGYVPTPTIVAAGGAVTIWVARQEGVASRCIAQYDYCAITDLTAE